MVKIIVWEEKNVIAVLHMLAFLYRKGGISIQLKTGSHKYFVEEIKLKDIDVFTVCRTHF